MSVRFAAPATELVSNLSSEPTHDHMHFIFTKKKIRDVESEIVFYRKHLQSIFNEFYQILQRSELLAFDLLMAQCLTGQMRIDPVDRSRIGSFIDRCASFGFDPNNTENQLERAIDHIQYVHRTILQSVDELSECKFDSVMLRDGDITALFDKIRSTQVNERHAPVVPETPSGQFQYVKKVGAEAEQFQVPDTFLHEIAVLIGRDVEDSTPEIARARSLLGKIACRVTQITELKKQIRVMKEEFPRESITTSAIYDSPFYKNLVGTTAFLRTAYASIHEQMYTMNNCLESLHVYSYSVKDQQSKAVATMERIREQQNELLRDLKKKDDQITDIRKDIDDIRNVLMPEEMVQTIRSDIAAITTSVAEIESLIKDIEDANTRTMLEMMWGEVNESRSALMDLTSIVIDKRIDDSMKKKQLFSCASGVVGQGEANRLVQREIDVLDQYSKALSEVREGIDKPAVDSWCAHVTAIAQEMKKSADEIQKAMLEVQHEAEIDEDILRLQEELEMMQKQEEELCQKRAAVATLVAERKDQLCEQLQENDIYKKWREEELSRSDKYQLNKWKDHIYCYCKNDRLCEVVNIGPDKNGCKHAMCLECSKTGVCPICHEKLKESGLRRFTFDPRK